MYSSVLLYAHLPINTCQLNYNKTVAVTLLSHTTENRADNLRLKVNVVSHVEHIVTRSSPEVV